MPPVLGPESRSPARLKSWARTRGTTSRPSVRPKAETSLPVRCSSTRTTAPAGGKPVGLDHVRRRQLVQVLDGLVHIGERPGTPGGDPILVAQLFCPRLRSLDPGRSPGGAERPVPFGIQLVHQAVHERRLRAHHREVDGFPLDQFEDAAHVVRIHGNAGGIHGDPGIAWCGEHPVDRRVLGQAPHDGVLPPSPTDDEDPHATARLCSRAGPTETTPIRTPTRSWRRSTYLRAAGGRLPNERASDSDSSHPSNSSYTGCARWNTDWCEGMSSSVSPSATYPVHTLIARNPESTSSLVRKISDRPVSRAAYRTRTASNHPHRRLRPVVVPNSFPDSPKRSPSGPRSSVGNGPDPTLVT